MVVAGARAGPPPLGRQFLPWQRLRMAGMSRTGSPRVSWPGPPICKEAPPTLEEASPMSGTLAPPGSTQAPSSRGLVFIHIGASAQGR